jgi:D-sedoheptulose 7-phosphate isomerase
VNTSGFIEGYVSFFAKALGDLVADEIDTLVASLLDAYERNARIFIAGNGGSASLAAHFACDLEKSASGPNPRLVHKRLRAQSLNENMATLTAWANDEGYRHVFAEQLRTHAESGDVLIVISASGNSPNIVAALETAAEIGVSTIALTGFDGGRAQELADQSLHVAANDYGVVEGIHGVLTHVVSACLALALSERRLAASEASAHLRPQGEV